MGASSSKKLNEQNNPEPELKLEIQSSGSPMIPLDVLDSIKESSKSVCKITIKELNLKATGFFLSDLSKNKFLVTNNHVISKDIIDSNMTIIIEKYNQDKYDLKLNNNERYIEQFKKPLDITIIKINDLEKLFSNIKFFSVDLNYKMGYNIYLKKDIYLLGYPYGKNVTLSPGYISNIQNHELFHNCSTDFGSSGSPIILSSNFTVIGIHKAGIIKEKTNVGTFLGAIFNQNDCILNNDNQEININKSISTKKKKKRKKICLIKIQI